MSIFARSDGVYIFLALLLGIIAAYGHRDFGLDLPGFFKARCAKAFNGAYKVTSGQSAYLYAYDGDTSLLRVCTNLSLTEWVLKSELSDTDIDCFGDPLFCATSSSCSSITDRDEVISQASVEGSALNITQVLDLPPAGLGWGWSFEVGFDPNNAKFPHTPCNLAGTNTYFREMASSIDNWSPCQHPTIFEVRSTFKTGAVLLVALVFQLLAWCYFIGAATCCINCSKCCDRRFRENEQAFRRALLCETPIVTLYAFNKEPDTFPLRGPFGLLSFLIDLLVVICAIVVIGRCYFTSVPFLLVLLVFKLVKMIVQGVRYCFTTLMANDTADPAVGNAGMGTAELCCVCAIKFLP